MGNRRKCSGECFRSAFWGFPESAPESAPDSAWKIGSAPGNAPESASSWERMRKRHFGDFLMFCAYFQVDFG